MVVGGQTFSSTQATPQPYREKWQDPGVCLTARAAVSYLAGRIVKTIQRLTTNHGFVLTLVLLVCVSRFGTHDGISADLGYTKCWLQLRYKSPDDHIPIW